jgi:hypothetical protein
MTYHLLENNNRILKIKTIYRIIIIISIFFNENLVTTFGIFNLGFTNTVSLRRMFGLIVMTKNIIGLDRNIITWLQ